MEQKIKTLQIIHLSLIMGVIVGCIALGDVKNIFSFHIEMNDLIFLALPMFGFFIGKFIFQKIIQNLKREQPLDEKIAIYQTASIVRWAILEGICFVILIFKPELLILNLVVIFLMLGLRPTKNHIKQTLNLKETDFIK